MSNNLPKSYEDARKGEAIRRNIIFLRDNGVKVSPTQEKRMLRGESILESGIVIDNGDTSQ